MISHPTWPPDVKSTRIVDESGQFERVGETAGLSHMWARSREGLPQVYRRVDHSPAAQEPWAQDGGTGDTYKRAERTPIELVRIESINDTYNRCPVTHACTPLHLDM